MHNPTTPPPYPQRLRLALIDFVATAIAALGLLGLARLLAPMGDPWAVTWAVGSLGASMTLILACPESPLARPYAAIVGNTVSAVIGVATYKLLGDASLPLAALIAVALSIATMRLLGALHPPGGATAILAVVGGAAIHDLGWLYALHPIALGTAWLLVIARARQKLTATLIVPTPTRPRPNPAND